MSGIIASAVVLGAGMLAQIKSDEEVIFFPTAAWQVPADGEWQVPIHGWIFEPELESLRRNLALTALCQSLELPPDAAENQLFRSRARMFLADNERNKTVAIRLGKQTYTLDASDSDGHFSGLVRLSPKEVAELTGNDRRDPVIEFAAIVLPGDNRTFRGRIQFVVAEGWSVVSDIDDTIKVSEVLDKRKLLENTFFKPFQATPGMVDAYRRLADRGAVVHYVSASPWHLYPSLVSFAEAAGYPSGTWQLKRFRVGDEKFWNLFQDPVTYKLAAIESLFQNWPQRRFILIGDTGEKDPEVYGELARKHAEQIEHIWLRDVTGEEADSPRYRRAFRDVPGSRWKLFTDGAAIQSPPQSSAK